MELWVFDINFNRLKIIDDYEYVQLDTYYQRHSELQTVIPATKEYIDLFLNGELRIIVRSNDVHRGYLVGTEEFTDGNKKTIHLYAKSLSILLNYRFVIGQQRYVGNVEDVIKEFINKNAIDTHSNRVLPNLVLGVNDGIDIDVEETYANRELDLTVFEICSKHEMGFEVLMDFNSKKYIASTFKGLDRSIEQSTNPHVIFSKQFDNVNTQSYVDDASSEKSAMFVVGDDNLILSINDEVSGYDRKEVFYDPGIAQTYQNEEGNSITMTEEEYENALIAAGRSELSEYKRIRTFESEVDPDTQYVYGVDFFIGDKVTNRNDDIGIVTNSRVMTAKEEWNRQGYQLSLEFGSSIPTLIDGIKRAVRR